MDMTRGAERSRTAWRSGTRRLLAALGVAASWLVFFGAAAQASTITYNLTLEATFVDDGAGVLLLSPGDSFQVTLTVDDEDQAANPQVGIYAVLAGSLTTPGASFVIPGPGLSATDSNTRIGELGFGEIKLLQQEAQTVPGADDVRFQLARIGGQSTDTSLFPGDALPATLPDPAAFDLVPLAGEFRFVVNASTAPTVTVLRGAVTSVPEPSTALLLGGGLALLARRRRRTRCVHADRNFTLILLCGLPLIAGCGGTAPDLPTLEQAREAIAARIAEGTENGAEIITLEKADAVAGEVMGMRVYTIEFTGTLRANEDLHANPHSYVFGSCAFSREKQRTLPCSGNGPKRLVAGSVYPFSGQVGFAKKESGWVPETPSLKALEAPQG